MLIINNKSGYVYNYVILTILFIFSICVTYSKIIDNKINIEKEYNYNIQLYKMGKYFIEESLCELNKYISSKENEIDKKILDKISNMDNKNIIEFIKKDKNVYEGNFYLKDPKTNTINSLYKKLYKQNLDEYVKNYINKQMDIIKNIDNYTAKIYYKYDTILSKTIYKITCQIEDIETKQMILLDSIIDYTEIDWEEVVIDNYLWNNLEHKYFGKGISQNVDIDLIINDNINLPDIEYSKNYPLYITNEDRIDILKFYENDKTQNTILIINNKDDTYIYTSDNNKNNFKGIILCRGNLNFLEGEYLIEGDIIAQGDILYNKNLNNKINKDLLAEINFDKIENKRLICDFLNITKYIENEKYPLIYFDINVNNSIMLKKENKLEFNIISIVIK